jgi:hypothetical protein
LNIFQDFGISFDEPGIYNFAPIVLDMYSTAFHPPEKPVYQRESFLHSSKIPTDLFNYGPFYFIATELLVRGFHSLGLQIPSWDLWHLTYFLTFEAGLLIFYLLCRRYLSGWASLAATILFATQPLIIGHVFMNPKDTPFMIFFMAAVWSGFVMTDKFSVQPPIQSHRLEGNLFNHAKTEWQQLSQEPKIKASRDLLLVSGLLILFLIVLPVLDSLVQRLITAMYSASPGSVFGSILRALSSNAHNIPLTNFIAKSHNWLRRLEYLVILLLIGRALWIVYSLLPESGHRLIQGVSSPFRLLFRSLINPFVLLAGVLLGLTLSIRLFAPLAGALVLINLFWKARRQAIAAAIAYGLTALITCFLTWPYLWSEPIKHLFKSWQVMNAFSTPGSWFSLPSLLAIQYTEPAVILAVVGIVIAIVEFIRRKPSGLLFLFLGWTLLPMSVLTLKESTLYNNFRQVLFIIPPFFIIAGLAIEKIIQLVRQPVVIGLLFLIMILPSIFADLSLHPYEYVYYNQFIGGVQNASRQYDTDYWGISAKETAQFLNETAPANATILTCTPIFTMELYLRADLRATSCEDATVTSGDYDYLVLSGNSYINKSYYPGTEVVFSVNRENTVLAMIKYLK